MRWPRRRTTSDHPVVDPIVVSVTSPLNRQTALDLARTVDRLEPEAHVVIDLTAIPAFDTDGAEELLHFQESHPKRRVSIVGLRQATARLMGTTAVDDADLEVPSTESQWVQRRLRNLVVVQAADESQAAEAGLEQAIVAAGDTDSAILVVDFRGLDHIERGTIEAVAFASSSAAVRGQELLVVNVSPETAEELRAVGLSATTYIAPEPFDF